MPKILESVREQLLKAARRQLFENGYAGTTIRSVAAACGIAVGTVYNYFPSKEMLIAAFVAEDWRACVASIEQNRDGGAEALLHRIYDALRSFSDAYRPLFSDADARKIYHTAAPERHKQLRSRIASLIAPVSGGPDGAFCSEFIAEALLTWTSEGRPFGQIYAIIQKLIEREETCNEQL